MKKFLYLVFMLFFITSNFAQKTETKETNFELAVKKHLKAIDQKDFESFKTTITNNKDFNLILPNGVHFSTKSQFLDFTKAWFSETTWEMKYTIISMKETSEMGFVLLMVNYSDVDQNKNPYSLIYYLNLIFAKENEEWKLIHDQNTMCYDQNK